MSEPNQPFEFKIKSVETQGGDPQSGSQKLATLLVTAMNMEEHDLRNALYLLMAAVIAGAKGAGVPVELVMEAFSAIWPDVGIIKIIYDPSLPEPILRVREAKDPNTN